MITRRKSSPTSPPGLYDQGQGEPVILLHSSLSSHRQWNPLRKRIGDRYRILEADLHGYGAAKFPSAVTFGLDDEADRVEPLLARFEGPCHLVGHSYGAAVTFQVALRYPGRVKSVFAYEPVLFHLLRDHDDPEWGEILALSGNIMRATVMRRFSEAAQVFIDYWSGPGSWDALPPERQEEFARMVPKVVLDFQALLAADMTLDDLASLPASVCIASGTSSPGAARRVAERLESAFGSGSLQHFDGAGHLAPITDPDRVNALIEEHLRTHSLP